MKEVQKEYHSWKQLANSLEFELDGQQSVSEQGILGVPDFPKVVINIIQDEAEMSTKINAWQKSE
jgi:hypothetical protein